MSALSSLSGGAPPAPNPQPPQMAQGGSALAGMPPMPPPSGGPGQNGHPGGPQGQQQPPQQQAPPPSHQQTVSALRHFGAMEKEIKGLLRDPACGKSDIKSQVIDGATRLVADGISTASDAIRELGSFPDRPFEQKEWLMQRLSLMQKAQVSILAHHQAGYLGQNVDTSHPKPEDHHSMMSSLLANYQGAKSAG